MKILLINSNLLKPPITPLGLVYVATATRAAGYDVAVLDLNFSNDLENDIKDAIISFKPHVIGLSIRNIDNVTMLHSEFFIPKVKEIVGYCEKYSSKPIVLGGPGFSMMPVDILKYLDLSYGVVGEGEIAFPQLLEKLCSDNGNKMKDFNDIPGLVFRVSIDREKGEFIINNPKNMTSRVFNELSMPDRAEFLEGDHYIKEGGMGNIQTKRGCDQACIYCTYPVIEGTNLRYRQAKEVVDEIEYMVNKLGIDFIHFSDSTFNIPNSHAFKICREWIKRGIKVRWTPYLSNINPDKELLKLLVETGCDGVTYGPDSVSEKMLKNLKKGFKVADIMESTNLCKELNISFSLNLLFGGPGETKETVIETLNNLEKINPDAVGAMIGIRCFPGTELAEIAKEQGVYEESKNLLEPFYYVSPEIDKGWLVETITRYARTHDWFWIPESKEGLHTDADTTALYRDENIRGTFWEVNKEVKLNAVSEILEKLLVQMREEFSARGGTISVAVKESDSEEANNAEGFLILSKMEIAINFLGLLLPEIKLKTESRIKKKIEADVKELLEIFKSHDNALSMLESTAKSLELSYQAYCEVNKEVKLIK